MKHSPSPPNYSKDYWKLLLLNISINWLSLVTSWAVVQEIYSKLYLVSCTNNTHRDVTDFANHGMIENRKTWISWERNIILLCNKKNFNMCLKWHILKSYNFVVGVTFKKIILAWITAKLLENPFNIAKIQEFELIILHHFKDVIIPKPEWNSQWSPILPGNLNQIS